MVYTIFFVGAVLKEKFAKQNDYFEEFLYSNVLVKYYGIQLLLEEKTFLKKPPLLAVSFKYDSNRLICGSIPFKSMMINFRQPKSSSSHVCC